MSRNALSNCDAARLAIALPTSGSGMSKVEVHSTRVRPAPIDSSSVESSAGQLVYSLPVGNVDSEGPVPLGPDDDIIWFASGRVAVLVPRTVTGGLDEAVRKLAERYDLIKHELALAIIVKDDMDRPGEEMRRGIRRTLERFAPMIVCNSIVVLGTGLFRSFFISLLSRIVALAERSGVSREIHTDLEAAAVWMHERLGDPATTSAEILDVLRWAESQSP